MKVRSNIPYNFKTGSDCEVIIPLYKKYRANCPKYLDGMFGFVLSEENGDFIIARDPIGIIPLYIGWDANGCVWVASEMKAIIDDCKTFQQFPPGHVFSSTSGKFERYFEPLWLQPDNYPNEKLDLLLLKNTLIHAVEKRMMSDVPWGVLLSGGLDSSLVAAIATKLVQKRTETGWPILHTFSIGLKDSPDIKAAKEVSEFLSII